MSSPHENQAHEQYLFVRQERSAAIKAKQQKNVVGVVLSCRFKDIRQERITRDSLLFSQQMLVSYRYSYPQLITTKPFLCCIVPFALTRMDGARTKKRNTSHVCGRYSKWKISRFSHFLTLNLNLYEKNVAQKYIFLFDIKNI